MNNTIDNIIKNSKNQSTNSILDFSNKNETIDKILVKVENIYNNNKRKWINKIIVKRNNKLIIILKRD